MVEVVREEVTAIPDGLTILATGPLTSPALEADLNRLIGARHLYFYDAIAPIVSAESIDMERCLPRLAMGQAAATITSTAR